jgi:hypothetical protein
MIDRALAALHGDESACPVDWSMVRVQIVPDVEQFGYLSPPAERLRCPISAVTGSIVDGAFVQQVSALFAAFPNCSTQVSSEHVSGVLVLLRRMLENPDLAASAAATLGLFGSCQTDDIGQHVADTLVRTS